MRRMKKWIALVLCLCMFSVSCLALTGCSSVGDGKKIIRIAHSQSETHPEHLGLLKFKEYVEENLGDKYEVQIYPNELLGSQKKAIELTQTGAIDFTLVGTPNLENFADVYEVFSMPYLFTSEEAYHAAMMDTDYMDKIYESTDEAGFRVLTWYDVGSRSFYAKKKIETPTDLKGLKIRVQESPASIKMANAFGAAASPMSFGEVAKYYSYNRHQMVPDVLVGNLKFLNSLSDDEMKVFKEAAALSTEVEREEWSKQVEQAKKIAQEDMGVTFVDVDVQPFKEAVKDVQKEMLADNPDIKDLYEHIQTFNAKYEGKGDD